jgi:thioredoxin 1
VTSTTNNEAGDNRMTANRSMRGSLIIQKGPNGKMDITVLTSDNIGEIIDDQTTVVIDFRASWCGPCELFEEVFSDVASKHGDVAFTTVDVEAEPDLADEFGIEAVPTLVIIRDKNLLFSHTGMVSNLALEDLLEQVRAVDLDEVC